MPVPKVAVRGVTVDVTDLSRGRQLWSRLLGVEVEAGNETFVWPGEVAPGLRLILQRVPEPKTVEDRVHIEVSPADPDSAITRVESPGGTRIDDGEGPDHAPHGDVRSRRKRNLHEPAAVCGRARNHGDAMIGTSVERR